MTCYADSGRLAREGKQMVTGEPGLSCGEMQASSGKLGGFPIVAQFLQSLKVRETIDNAVPMHPLNHVSHGECIEALVLSILRENHSLVNVSRTLSGYDLPRILGRAGIQPEHFNDTRLGQALDALSEGHEKVFGNLALNAIRGYHLETRRTHIDSTSIKVYGSYDDGDDFSLFARRGHSKDHRPDLKQFMFSMSVNEDGVPLIGRMIDGNSSDNQEFRWHLAQIDDMLAGMRETVMIADCKLCTYETMVMALERDLAILTLLPESFSLQRQLRETASQEELPLLYTSESGFQYHGRSYVVPHAWTSESGDIRYPNGDTWLYIRRNWQSVEKKSTGTRGMKSDNESTSCWRTGRRLLMPVSLMPRKSQETKSLFRICASMISSSMSKKVRCRQNADVVDRKDLPRWCRVLSFARKCDRVSPCPGNSRPTICLSWLPTSLIDAGSAKTEC